MLNPCLAVSYCGLGDSLAFEGRISEAIPYFQRAIDLSPVRSPALGVLLLPERLLTYLRGSSRPPTSGRREPRGCRMRIIGPSRIVSRPWGTWNRPDTCGVATGELLQRMPDFACSFARKRLFYVKNPEQLAFYVEGLRRAGIPE